MMTDLCLGPSSSLHAAGFLHSCLGGFLPQFLHCGFRFAVQPLGHRDAIDRCGFADELPIGRRIHRGNAFPDRDRATSRSFEIPRSATHGFVHLSFDEDFTVFFPRKQRTECCGFRQLVFDIDGGD